MKSALYCEYENRDFRIKGKMVTPKPYLPEKRAKYTNSQKFAIISLYSLGYLLGGLVHRNSSREVTMIMNLVNF